MRTSRTLRYVCFVACVLACLYCSGLLAQQAAMEVRLNEGAAAKTSVTIRNFCKIGNNYQVSKESLPFFFFDGSTQVSVAPMGSEQLPAHFDTKEVPPGEYSGKVTVICLTCSEDPTCTQDREVFPIHLTVAPKSVTSTGSETSINPPPVARQENPPNPAPPRPTVPVVQPPPTTKVPVTAPVTPPPAASAAKTDKSKNASQQQQGPAPQSPATSEPEVAQLQATNPEEQVQHPAATLMPLASFQAVPWWLGGLVLLGAAAGLLSFGGKTEDYPQVLGWMAGSPLPPGVPEGPPPKMTWGPEDEQRIREAVLRKAAKDRDDAAKKLPGAIDKYNKANEEYEKAQEEYLKAKDDYELWKGYVEGHPLERPPHKNTIRQREIHRKRNDDGSLKPPTKDDLSSEDYFTRRMTQAECEEELEKQKAAMDYAFEKVKQKGKEWTAARTELDKVSKDIGKADKDIDLARLELWKAAQPPADPLAGLPHGAGVPPLVEYTPRHDALHGKPIEIPGHDGKKEGEFEGMEKIGGRPALVEWDPRHQKELTAEEREKMLKKFNEDHPAVVIYPPPNHEPGEIEFDGNGYAVSWWLPPTAGVEDEIRYYHSIWEQVPHPEPVAEPTKENVPRAPVKIPLLGEDDDGWDGDDDDDLGENATIALPLVDEVRRWAKEQFGIDDPQHPLIQVLLDLGRELGRSDLLALLAEVKSTEPLHALIEIMQHLGERDSAGSSKQLDVQRTILALLDDFLSDPNKQKQWAITNVKLIQDLLIDNVSRLVDVALKAGTEEALVTALIALARPKELGGNVNDPRAPELAKKLNELISKQEHKHDESDLTKIHGGKPTVPELREMALHALKDGRLKIFAEALMTAILNGNDPPQKKATETIGLVEILKKFGGVTPNVTAAKSGGTGRPADVPHEASLPPGAAETIERIQQQARDILSGIQKRIDQGLGPQIDEALDRAKEELGHAGSATELARKSGDENQKKNANAKQSELQDKVKDLARLKFMLGTVTMDEPRRRAELERLRGEAQKEVNDYEVKRLVYDGEGPNKIGWSIGHAQALRAIRDAAEDMLFAFNPNGIDPLLSYIYDQLNGTPKERNEYGGLGFRENGVRQRLDAARKKDEDSGETHRLEDELNYLEQRRFQLVFQHPSWNAMDKYIDIKKTEEAYWQGQRTWKELAWLGETGSDRISKEASQFRSRDLPGLINQIGRDLDEKDKDPQGFIRLLAKLKKEDVRHGAEAWEAYYNTSWSQQGSIVHRWRVAHVFSIIDEMGKDHELYEALRAAGEIPADRLKATAPQAYEKLVEAGFIHYGQYAIPENFTYSPETVGSKMSERHWLDDLVSAKNITEVVATVLLPGAAAAYLVDGLRAFEGASALTRAGWALLRGGSEAALFTVFSRGAKALSNPFAVSGKEYTPEALAKEYATNLVAIIGLGQIGRASKYLEKALIGEGKIALALGKPLWGAGKIGKDDLIALLKGSALDLAKTGLEAGAMTGMGALPVIGNGGHFDPETFLYNVVFMKELALAHSLTPSAVAERNRDARIVGRPEARQEFRLPEERSGSDPRRADVDTPRVPSRGPEESVWDHFQKEVGLPDTPYLKDFLQGYFERLGSQAKDPRVREISREMARILKGNQVPVSFSRNPAATERGSYDPVERYATVNIEVIARSVREFYRNNYGRDASPGEFLKSLLGTTVHEVYVHAYQGDALPFEEGGARQYSVLQEMEALLAQRIFDTTLGGKDLLGPWQNERSAFQTIRDLALKTYGNIDPDVPDKSTETGLTPDELEKWQELKKDSLVSQVNRSTLAKLRIDKFYEHLRRYRKANQKSYDTAVRDKEAKLRKIRGMEPPPGQHDQRKGQVLIGDPEEFGFDDPEENDPINKDSAKKDAIHTGARPEDAGLSGNVRKLKAVLDRGGSPSLEQILELQRNTQDMRCLKNADPALRSAFNKELRLLYDKHDAAVLRYIREHVLGMAGKELRVDDFRTPGTENDPSAINTDRDYRVIAKETVNARDRWMEVPRRSWEGASHDAFADLTGYSDERAYELLTTEGRRHWERLPGKSRTPAELIAKRKAMWAEMHQQLATDVWHPEASLDFSDQPSYAYDPLREASGPPVAPDSGRPILIIVKNILLVKDHLSGQLLDPQRFGMMYNEKADVYLRMGNKVEAMAQMTKGIDMLEAVRKAYETQGYDVGELSKAYLNAAEAIKALRPFDHTISPWKVRDLEATLRTNGFRGLRDFKESLDSQIHSLGMAHEKRNSSAKTKPAAAVSTSSPVTSAKDGSRKSVDAASPFGAKTAAAPSDRPPRRVFDWKMLAYPAAFGLLAALTTLLPATLPGEISAPRMTMRTASDCSACPASEQILGLGLLKTKDATALNVVLAAPPSKTDLTVHFDGLSQDVQLKKRSDDSGGWDAVLGPVVQEAPPLHVASRGSLIVFEFPASLNVAGALVKSASGDQFPASGFVPAQSLPTPSFNLVDLLLIALLGISAWVGYKRGFVIGAVGSAGLVLVLLLAAFLYKPLASVLGRLGEGSRADMALAFGVSVAVLGLAAHFLARFVAPFLFRMFSSFTKGLGSGVERILGVVPAWLRTCLATAMLFTIAVDLASFSWAGTMISTSRMGSLLVSMWRGLFPGL